MRQCLQLYYNFLYFLIFNQIVVVTFGVVNEIKWVLVHNRSFMIYFCYFFCAMATYIIREIKTTILYYKKGASASYHQSHSYPVDG